MSDGEGEWTVVKSKPRKPPAPKPKQPQPTVGARRPAGPAVVAQKKFAAGTNKQHKTDVNMKKLDEETPEKMHVDRVPAVVGQRILAARNTKGWTQKDLAMRISEQATVVADFETGRAVMNHAILNKIERALGTKVR